MEKKQGSTLIQTRLTSFIRTDAAAGSSEDSDFSFDAARPPSNWTRVKSRDMMRARRVVVFDLNRDLDDRNALKVKGATPAVGRPSFLFDPDTFDERQRPLKVSDHQLSREELYGYGVLAT